MKQQRRSTPWNALAAILALTLALPSAAQTTWTVTSTGDDAADPTTLRGAIAAAADGDTIHITAEGIIYPNSTIEVTNSLSIVGPGSDKLALDGQGTNSVMTTGFTWVNGPIPSLTVSISGLTIRNGIGGYGGAIVNGSLLTLSNCAITGNAGMLGGAIFNGEVLTVTDCTFSHNVASSDSWSGDVFGFGGAIFNVATTTLTRCTFSNNSAVNAGGAVLNGLPIGLGSGGDAATTITGCVFTGNSVTWAGENTATFPGGGAIYSGSSGGSVSLAIKDSTISSNTAAIGGAVCIMSTGEEDGGTFYPARSEATIVGSTFSGNTAVSGFFPYVLGGAIAHLKGSAPVTRMILTIDNSTLSGNAALSTGNGILGAAGAMANYGGDLIINNSTFAANSDSAGVSGVLFAGCSPSIKNTILANDPAGANLAADNPGYDFINSYGFNLSSDNGGGFLTNATDRINTDPMLGPLADNGGPTMTHALLTGSPAIDNGHSTDVAGNIVAADQRGIARPQGGGYDIGAFELAVRPNHAPVADAGPDQNVSTTNGAAAVTLDGSASSDPDGDTLAAYVWMENGSTIATGTTSSVVLTNGTHTITLTVTDPYGATATDTVVVKVAAMYVSPTTYKFDTHDKQVKWTIKNAGTGKAEIKDVTISFPDARTGNLLKLELKGTIFTGSKASPATISAFTGTAAARTFNPGEKRELKFTFQKNVPKTGYTITVNFTNGCTLSITK